MRLLEFARNKAYWILDFLGGGAVKAHLKTITRCNDCSMSEAEIEQHQNLHIKKLLRHCQKTVPFYRDMDNRNLTEWPVITKSEIKDAKMDFISTKFDPDTLIQMSTSGSTGTPFVSLQNKDKKKTVNAETMYYMGLLGYKVGQRIIFLRSVVSECKKRPLQQFQQNIYQINCNDLSDRGIERKLAEIQKLSKKSGAFLIAYASTYEAFRKYFERNGYSKAADCKIHGIVSGSEMLYDATREAMKKAFRCRVVSRYANEENGFLGQDDSENNVFLTNRADYYIEILKFDSNEPAREGESGRIVVTDLFNYGLPMVRYDTGDVGALVRINVDGKDYQAICSFSGRAVDVIFDSKGGQLSPHAITNAMWRYQSLRQFKFIQTGKADYEIQINLGDAKIDETTLIKDMESILGKNSNISLTYVDEIPVLSSGKRRYIENRWKH